VVAAEVVVAGVVLLQALRMSIATNRVAKMKNKPFFTFYPPELI